MHYYYDKNNQKQDYPIMGEIHFKNNTQAAIWDGEIIGQLSDGCWENDDMTDWTFWICLQPVVDGTLGWSTYDKSKPDGRIHYDLNQLRKYVEDRMLELGKLGKIGVTDYKLWEAISRIKWFKPEKEVIEEIEKRFGSLEKLLADYQRQEYTMQDLEQDLMDIAKSMRTRLKRGRKTADL